MEQPTLDATADTPDRILFIDDDPPVRNAFRRSLRPHGLVVDLASGADEALAALAATEYAVIATDYRMPKVNGLELVAQMQSVQPDATFVMVSGECDLDLALEAVNEHHIAYVICKPWNIDELVSVLKRSIEQFWERSTQRRLQRSIVSASKDLDLQKLRLAEAMEAAETHLSASLLSTLDLRGHETRAHCKRVAGYARLIAEQMGLQGQIIGTIERGALLHDIGKIGIPDALLLKNGPLTPEEWEVMRTHPTLGARLLDGFDGLAGARAIVEQHHERWDGSGYPRGLAGEQIHIGARIFAVADALDALMSDRPYRAAGADAEVAVAEIKRCAGSQFDPDVVAAFVRVPASSLARVRRDHPDPGQGRPGAVVAA